MFYLIQSILIDFKKVNLSSYTTIKLGGACKFFIECSSEEMIIDTVKYAQHINKDLFILGGGSNVVFPDDELNKIVLKILINKPLPIKRS